MLVGRWLNLRREDITDSFMFDKLIQLGPAYGYFAEPTKSVLVVAPQFEGAAKDYFRDLVLQCQVAIAFLVV